MQLFLNLKIELMISLKEFVQFSISPIYTYANLVYVTYKLLIPSMYRYIYWSKWTKNLFTHVNLEKKQSLLWPPHFRRWTTLSFLVAMYHMSCVSNRCRKFILVKFDTISLLLTNYEDIIWKFNQNYRIVIVQLIFFCFLGNF